jgi:hypothetical protein
MKDPKSQIREAEADAALQYRWRVQAPFATHESRLQQWL